MIQIPDEFMGRPVKGAIERVLSKQNPQPMPQANATFQNINPNEYLIIPNTNAVISIAQNYNGFKYEQAHKEVLKAGLSIPSPILFMKHFVNVINAYKGKTKIYTVDGKELNKKKVEELYKFLTTDYKIGNLKGAWTYLNAKFIDGTGFNNLDLETITGINANGDLITKKEPLEECLNEDCYIDLIFNKQGLPTKKSKNQKYILGENAHFWYPRKNCVARFYAGSGRSNLDCYGNPQYSNCGLGVFACAEGTRKN